ncbi:hypothetical protein BJ508DRAFT_413752 [Ascobolus immersus RN42]|uniref:Uncharacterized protein n=1 Tax=Ascobolus immersus RN42 TaxID=1160509 RepID=A0A3N4IAI5_ASCIM|nr:hypothetical protein BJ508DRAFT_413752 [Ascobolus immersus RN42]
MCFYDQTIYACNDFKWGRFRTHCAKEYRTGETCGMKLIYQTTRLAERCTTCKKMEVIKNKIYRSQEKIGRWAAENAFPVSLDLERTSVMGWRMELEQLEANRASRRRNFG